MNEHLNWFFLPFADLSTHQLYDIISLRERVFIVEQNCIYLDCDGFDPIAVHLFAYENQNLVAYLRVLPKNTKYPQLSYGRVATAPEARAQGLGKLLNQKAILHLKAMYPGEELKISAQSYLKKFYESFGLKPIGKEYLEDEIPHIEMKMNL